jgi:beta-lactam-binding protein with PASTA domain/predicted Ser/Thr protein kinase
MNGSVLSGRYRIEARIGAGGMAEVYRGIDPVLNRTVAIKVLLPQFARDTSFVERFRREAQAAARLNHPNIVGVFDTGSDDGTQFIVMEFIEGRTLADFLAAGRKPGPVQAAEVAQRICSALAAAHSQGVIHRDIKPGNVMVTRDGTVKVMDFGIARMTTGVETAPQTSAVLGTASYLSPEQAQGGPVDARTDIYSLGVVLYELLVGRPPFTGDSPVAVAFKQVNEAPIPPSQLNPDVPPRLDAVVMRALSKNPANRYQTALEFSEDLQRVIKGQEVQATPLMPAMGEATQVISRPQQTAVLPPQEEPQGSGRKVWLGVLIGVLVVGILGGAGYLLVNALTKDSSTQVKVVRVIGSQYEDAKRLLEAQGLHIQDPPKFKVTDAAAPGVILSQDPAEDTLVDKNSTVNVTVAKAPQTVPVPDLTGLTVSEAQTALDAAPGDLHIGSQTSGPSADIPIGHIVGQTPLPDAEVTKGTFVDVVISTGPQLVTVPDVVTDCLTVAQAQQRITDAGLIPVVSGTAPVNPGCPNTGKIAAQSPAPGTTVQGGSTVTISQGTTVSPSPSPSP